VIFKKKIQLPYLDRLIIKKGGNFNRKKKKKNKLLVLIRKSLVGNNNNNNKLESDITLFFLFLFWKISLMLVAFNQKEQKNN